MSQYEPILARICWLKEDDEPMAGRFTFRLAEESGAELRARGKQKRLDPAKGRYHTLDRTLASMLAVILGIIWRRSLSAVWPMSAPALTGGDRTRRSTDPVFVLTHHARKPLELEGETTFTFVTDGIEAALEQAVATPKVTHLKFTRRLTRVRRHLPVGR